MGRNNPPADNRHAHEPERRTDARQHNRELSNTRLQPNKRAFTRSAEWADGKNRGWEQGPKNPVPKPLVIKTT
jgi:hypothetical protein